MPRYQRNPVYCIATQWFKLEDCLRTIPYDPKLYNYSNNAFCPRCRCLLYKHGLLLKNTTGYLLVCPGQWIVSTDYTVEDEPLDESFFKKSYVMDDKDFKDCFVECFEGNSFKDNSLKGKPFTGEDWDIEIEDVK